MSKEYKNSNSEFREHFKLYGYLSPTMIEELLDEYDKLKKDFIVSETELNNWRKIVSLDND